MSSSFASAIKAISIIRDNKEVKLPKSWYEYAIEKNDNNEFGNARDYIKNEISYLSTLIGDEEIQKELFECNLLLTNIYISGKQWILAKSTIYAAYEIAKNVNISTYKNRLGAVMEIYEKVKEDTEFTDMIRALKSR